VIDAEIMAVVKLKLACGTILEFKADCTRNELNSAREEKKNKFIFSEYIFMLKINLEKSR
jgi:hypothetical protein